MNKLGVLGDEVVLCCLGLRLLLHVDEATSENGSGGSGDAEASSSIGVLVAVNFLGKGGGANGN